MHTNTHTRRVLIWSVWSSSGRFFQSVGVGLSLGFKGGGKGRKGKGIEGIVSK